MRLRCFLKILAIEYSGEMSTTRLRAELSRGFPGNLFEHAGKMGLI